MICFLFQGETTHSFWGRRRPFSRFFHGTHNYCVYALFLVRNYFKIMQQVWLSREHRLWDFPRAWNSVHRQNLSVRVIQPTLKQLGNKEGVRNDGKFFLNSKVWCVYFDLLKMIQLLFIEMNKLNNNSLGWMRQFHLLHLFSVCLCVSCPVLLDLKKWSGKSIMFLDCVIGSHVDTPPTTITNESRLKYWWKLISCYRW